MDKQKAIEIFYAKLFSEYDNKKEAVKAVGNYVSRYGAPNTQKELFQMGAHILKGTEPEKSKKEISGTTGTYDSFQRMLLISNIF
jgi:hypothetical protein